MSQGLSEAHAADIIHRDIKPANVIVTKSGVVKILDFGIAKLLSVTGPTQTGTTLGTVSYMSPEQVAGEDADQQSDVWALGAVLYEMLTGQQPFKGENQWAVMNAISNRTPDSPHALRSEIPAGVGSVVMRALKRVFTRIDLRVRGLLGLVVVLRTSAFALVHQLWPSLPPCTSGGPTQLAHRLFDRAGQDAPRSTVPCSTVMPGSGTL